MIHRQHESTSIPELRNALCSAFKAVSCAGGERYGIFFIELSGVWHRFYLDAGLLFWEEGKTPDPSEDLLEGERYTDMGKDLQIVGSAICEITMFNSQLTLQFDNGARLTLRNGVDDDGAEIGECVAGIK